MHAGIDNRISLRKLEIWCLVVELGGVGRAAEHLFVAQPVVTAHLRQLEQRLAAELFYRGDGRRLRLTESGERVYAWATQTLARTHDLSREISGLADGMLGSVVIAASMSIGSYLLPSILAEFRQSRPHAAITLTIGDPERAADAADRDECDFALVVAEHPPPRRHITCELVGHEAIVLVASPDGAPHADTVSVPELTTLPMVARPSREIRGFVVNHRLRRAGLIPGNVTIELGHPEAMKRAVEAGLGAAFLVRSSVQRELASGALREVEVVGASSVDLSVPVFLIRREEKQMTVLQAHLLSAVRDGVMTALQRAGDQTLPRGALGDRAEP